MLLAMKGTYPRDELGHLPPGYRVKTTVRLDVPLIGAERHLVLIEAAP